MIAYIWTNLLYTPVLNVLIYLYENVAGNNLGWAVVALTVLLRLLLLPLSIAAERNAVRYERLEQRVAALSRETQSDQVARKARIRELLQRERISPWAKVASFGFQALVLVLLYQVFLGGINYSKLTVLYTWVPQPDYINLKFFGFNIAERNLWWAAGIGLLLFLEITAAYRRRADLTVNDQLYRVIFPLLSFGVLALLPMVKSIFILTSMLFGFLLMLVFRLTFPSVRDRN